MDRPQPFWVHTGASTRIEREVVAWSGTPPCLKSSGSSSVPRVLSVFLTSLRPPVGVPRRLAATSAPEGEPWVAGRRGWGRGGRHMGPSPASPGHGLPLVPQPGARAPRRVGPRTVANQWQFSGKSVANQWQVSGKLVITMFPRAMRVLKQANPSGFIIYSLRIVRGNTVLTNLPLICH